MGLDMYAHTIKAELIGDQQVDINEVEAAVKAVGFTSLTDEEFQALDGDAQNAYHRARREAAGKAVDAGIYSHDFAYWRKFNHLHGWMEDLYHHKGGTSENFNCDTVRLMPEDIDALEDALSRGLPHRPGFFFGGEEIYEDDLKDTEDFIKRSREAIANGMAVIYSSWW